MNNSNEPIYDARKLGIPKMLILGIQHMFAMFGATILVPILVAGYFKDACGEPLTRGLTVSVTLFCAGFGTLIFHLCSKLKVPAFLGSSFAFLGGFYTVANLKNGIYATMNVNDKAAYACGGIVVAGLLYLVVALIFKLVGVNRVMKFLPPVVTGPDYHLHRFIPCTVSYFKCFNQLVDCIYGISGDYHFQYLGKRHV